MTWSELLDWLTKTVGVGTVAGAVYWAFDWIRRQIDRAPVVWALASIGRVTHTSWLKLHVRNREQEDLFVEAVEILRPAAVRIEDRHGRPLRKLRIEQHVPPCPPAATELPGTEFQARFAEPVSDLGDKLVLRVTLRRSRWLRPVVTVRTVAVISRRPG